MPPLRGSQLYMPPLHGSQLHTPQLPTPNSQVAHNAHCAHCRQCPQRAQAGGSGPPAAMIPPHVQNPNPTPTQVSFGQANPIESGWTAEQDAKLLQMKAENKTWAVIMNELKKTSKSEVQARFKSLKGGETLNAPPPHPTATAETVITPKSNSMIGAGLFQHSVHDHARPNCRDCIDFHGRSHKFTGHQVMQAAKLVDHARAQTATKGVGPNSVVSGTTNYMTQVSQLFTVSRRTCRLSLYRHKVACRPTTGSYSPDLQPNGMEMETSGRRWLHVSSTRLESVCYHMRPKGWSLAEQTQELQSRDEADTQEMRT